MGIIGQSVTRVDAPDKVTGRAKYTDDLAINPRLSPRCCIQALRTAMLKA